MRIDRTTVEYAEKLLGTDVPEPRLSWTLSADGHGAGQTAYQVMVTQDQAEVWDSGRVESARSVGIAYDGPSLRPRTRYYWQVRVWDRHGLPSAWSSTGWWETGMLGEPWSARWVGGATPGGRAPLLRREFTVDRPAVRARLYLSGLAYYEAEINGERVGGQVLDPGFTAYHRTVLYTVHDVTDLLSAGVNAIGVTLGRGFFGLTTPSAWNWERAPWHGEPRLLVQLEIDHPDGSRTTIGTDQTWTTTGGPTVLDLVYDGETYDARLAPLGWTRPGFDDGEWAHAAPVEAPKGTLRAQQHEPIEIVDTIRPAEIHELRPGVYVVDMGRTMAGWVKLSVRAPAGTRIRLLHGETLGKDGSVQAVNEFVYSERFQLDEYVCAGSGRETWEPRFTYKGFRYVQVSGLPSAPEAEDVLGRLVHSGVPETGTFRCAEPFFERLDRMMRRTVLNNLHGLPTDTPMYEKCGWTGDAQLGAPTMAFAFGVSRLLTKWIEDLADSQDGEGRLSVVVPSSGWGYRELAPAPEWTTVFPFLLREMYRWYGDDRLAARCWPQLARYLDWEIDRLEDGLATTALGDWLAPGYPGGFPPEDGRLTATAYLYRALLSAAEVGERCGQVDDAARYRSAAETCKDALNAEFLRDGHYRTNKDPDYRQTSNAIPLAFGMVPPEAEASVVASLVDDIRARGDHLNTGALGTSVLLPVLTAHGHAELAHAVATQRGHPSWGYWVDQGADTMWERWDAGARSRDHYFQGTVTDWLYRNVAGLRPGDGGYERFVVRPDARGGLEWASATIDTVRGRVSVAWSSTEDGLRLDVEVPVGASAEVQVPATGRKDVTAAPEAEFLRTEAGFVVLHVGQGRWRFTSSAA